jgi:hypothetical protein
MTALLPVGTIPPLLSSKSTAMPLEPRPEVFWDVTKVEMDVATIDPGLDRHSLVKIWRPEPQRKAGPARGR